MVNGDGKAVSGRAVVLGDVMLDVLAELSGPLSLGSDTPAPIRFRGGGSAANTAAWLAHAGIATSLVARVGDDPAADAALAGLRQIGVDLQVGVDPHLPTGTCVVLIHEDERTMIPSTGANAALAAADLPAIEDALHLHISGYALFTDARPAALAALEAARQAGVPVSVGAASAGPLRQWGAEKFFTAVGAALLFCNVAEAEVLSGRDDPADAARSIAARTGEAVVTEGSDGAYWSDGTTLAFAETVPLQTPNPVGAGDAYAAGFIAARLGGLGPTTALSRAHHLGALPVARHDGRPPYAG